MLSESVLRQLGALARRLEEIDRQLADPRTAADASRLRDLSCERGEIEPVVMDLAEYRRAIDDIEVAQAMLADPEMRAFAEEELENALACAAKSERALERALIPKDPDDERNAILEVRAGVGGDEAALFAGELVRMYARAAEARGFAFETMSLSEAELGGVREFVGRIVGRGAYGRFKFESGGHRVQRVPATETQGRIHTSSCTVAVMPEADAKEELAIRPSDLRIDVFRASGAGGQHVQKTESAVRITHLPTGITVECQDERSQTQNKARAMTVLAARLRAAKTAEEHARTADLRRTLIGSGDRSDRVRTYNFPQGRVTDHRINLTLYRLQSVLDGDLEEIVSALAAEDEARKLAGIQQHH